MWLSPSHSGLLLQSKPQHQRPEINTNRLITPAKPRLAQKLNRNQARVPSRLKTASHARPAHKKTISKQTAAPKRRMIGLIGLMHSPLRFIAVFTALLFCGVRRQIRTSENTERAWLLVDVKHDDKKWLDGKMHVLEGDGTEGKSTAFYGLLVCVNEGRSPAWIDEVLVKFEVVKHLPLTPNLSLAELIEKGPLPIGIGQAYPHTNKIEWPAMASGHVELGKMAVVWGAVRYRDI